ncbi:glycogen/starch/alpha-glucan phosphorylase [Oscillospiraceae bacterium OttesenSCG-928-G22]|nr:glycogen/starch/alpha-glucan phosphorylase [Oscillospiraceae bacterium OttesenSCG-928-G22]
MPSETAKKICDAIEGKLQSYFGLPLHRARKEEVFKAAVLAVRDISLLRYVRGNERSERFQERNVHYLSIEVLLGRMLEKTAFNLGILEPLREAFSELGYEADEVFDVEEDAALGNGGLGRLAACYLDAMASQGIPGDGYSLLYEHGIFKQRIAGGAQVELPELWRHVNDVWFVENPDEAYTVRFGGTLDYQWRNERLQVNYIDAVEVCAVPFDIPMPGYENGRVNRLRLWNAETADLIDMELFAKGDYTGALERRVRAESLTKVLYPEDSHHEGKMLRLKQQYFFVSATAQDLVRRHREEYGTLRNFHRKHIIQINDTHPALIIPELMRILLDDEGYSWDDAWRIVSRSVAYTNHTVMQEALETWPQDYIAVLLPRIWDILRRMNRLIEKEIEDFFPGDETKRRELSAIYGGQVRMANLLVMAGAYVNGVSGLHTEILKRDVFRHAYSMYPQKFVRVTNGIDHRRWLPQANPGLHDLIKELIGDSYLRHPSELERLTAFIDDGATLSELERIKAENKQRFAKYCQGTMGISINPHSIFDVQVKRIHEYKRQLLNVLHIISLYHRLKADRSIDILPHTFVFGGKAAPGYHMAKQIIRLVTSLSAFIAADPDVKDRLAVVFLPNYRVTVAERLIPATELSEQISLAGTEASGTGNMKFMLNGAITIGTLDGANVEMCEQVGAENMFLCGMRAEEVIELNRAGYDPRKIHNDSAEIRAVLDRIRSGFSDGADFSDIVSSLLEGGDRYRLLRDFESYRDAQSLADRLYHDRTAWNRKSLLNIAKAGYFSADRSILEYAERIWEIVPYTELS